MSWAIWITGMSGSGKSVLARGTADLLRARGIPVTVLELDAIRKIVTPLPTYSDGEREAVYRLLAVMAATLTEAGVAVIIDATANRRQWRLFARSLIPRFAEVQLECPLAVCRQREATRARGNPPVDIYARAGTPGATVRGVDREYEPAIAPGLVIDTTVDGVAAGAQKIAALAESLGDPTRVARTDGRGWALWITGPPGSGKTTTARRVADALAAGGVTAHILEVNALREAIGQALARSFDDLVHRALVCLAKLFVDAGAAVIVDAAAHRRRWRELARALIPRFAEIQLVCPAELCATRERATRWHLDRAVAVHEAPASVEAEIVVGYEPALCPELTVFTDVQDRLAVVDAVLFVARRLRAETYTRVEGRP
jgi:adenylylsulfate kinase